MRIKSIANVNTQQQQNPFLQQGAGLAISGKSAARVNFEECLRMQMQNNMAPATDRNAETHAAGYLWGYNMQQGISIKPEIRLGAREYKALLKI